MATNFGKTDHIISEFNRLITDDSVKEFILGGKRFNRLLKSTRSYPAYMNNCLILAFLYVYGCYRKFSAYSEEEYADFVPELNNNASRVLDSLKKTYVEHSLTPEFINYVLTDLQFDLQPGAPQNLMGIFGRVCNFSVSPMKNENFNLVTYFQHIAKWFVESSRNETDNSVWDNMFLALFSNLTFLQCHLCRFGDDYAFLSPGFYNFAVENNAITDDSLDEDFYFDNADNLELFDFVLLRHTVMKGDEVNTFGFYYLESVEQKNNLNALDLTYQSTVIGARGAKIRVSTAPTENTSVSDLINLNYSAEDYYTEITGIISDGQSDGLKKKERKLIDQVHAINYKYIKNLALAVSDAMGKHGIGKEPLESAFGDKYPSVFADGGDSASRLDGIIIMLMIEESPTAVLEVLFADSDRLFRDVAQNIDRRFADSSMFIHNKNKAQLDAAVNKIIEEKRLRSEHTDFAAEGSSKSTITRLRPVAQTMLIMSSLLNLVEGKNKLEYIYGGNIYANIETLKEMRSNIDRSFKVDYVNNLIVDTFKHIICFYEGVFAYGELKREFDVKAANACLSREEIEGNKNDLFACFMKAARSRAELFKTAERYAQNNVMLYIDDFIELCKRCYDSKLDRDKLFAATGKREIIDLELFDQKLSLYMGNETAVTVENVDKWMNFALVILEYFKSGSFSDTPIDYDVMNAIYPFTAVYTKQKKNREGHTTVTFTISIDIDDNGSEDFRHEINVLSEYEYDLPEIFYCLPNIQRSNSRLWIDPVLIRFTAFNDIFKRGEE